LSIRTETLTSGRLWTIDALRGAAAMGVVVYHARSMAGVLTTDAASAWFHAAAFWGQYGVWLFFVVSGFCIHLQWAVRARNGDLSPPRFLAFWRRRWVRLYPPYLAALAIYVGLHYLNGAAFTSRWLTTIGWHVLLIQNIDPAALNAINEVFWTLAVEEQLYLLYFVLLPVRIRYGWPAAIAMAALARVGWFVLAALIHRLWNVDIIVTQSAMAQWIVWVLGALSVEVWCGMVSVPEVFRHKAAAALLPIGAAFTTYVYLYMVEPGTVRDVLWLTTDYVWGLAFFAVINWSVRQESTRAPLGRVLARVGLFSYSLYLSHEIVTHTVWPALRALAPGSVPAIALIPAGLCASLAFAWLFFVCLERPFLRRGHAGAIASSVQQLGA
jgi:peptidoglycan/LPS O-acetylase OafA/YrhL